MPTTEEQINELLSRYSEYEQVLKENKDNRADPSSFFFTQQNAMSQLVTISEQLRDLGYTGSEAQPAGRGLYQP